MLSVLMEKYLNPHNDPRIYTAREVTFDYGLTTQKRVDFMKFIPENNSISGIEQGHFYAYEVKSSKADFNSPNGHNFLGDYNYYVMLTSVYEELKDLIPYNVGVICPDPKRTHLNVVKKARKVNRTKALPELLLMMFRSSNRELIKLKKGEEISE